MGELANLSPLEGVSEREPIGGVCGEEPHAVALEHGQGHAGQVAQDEDQLLAQDVHSKTVGSRLEGLEDLVH